MPSSVCGRTMEESVALKYKRVVDGWISGENYRCWPSHQHDGCLLSVFSLDEAIDVCESHVQCRAFVMTNRTTWTGKNYYIHMRSPNETTLSSVGALQKCRDQLKRGSWETILCPAADERPLRTFTDVFWMSHSEDASFRFRGHAVVWQHGVRGVSKSAVSVLGRGTVCARF
ncbi:hypothetical protein DNTS_008802 [Danionella cerebrum]|uniref:Uncharacterized protein n=1 Tax=Danionella cerebrum TaxID=2873325 RepID=A0A553Q6V3_9TELE|nr:hypothetical protein DNTS_008802 [Danionella translucida]